MTHLIAAAATRTRPRTGAAASPATTPKPLRRPRGQIPLLVLAHLHTHRPLDFSPYEVAKALDVSHGTVRRHLLRLANAGQVRRTSLTPARFQAS